MNGPTLVWTHKKVSLYRCEDNAVEFKCTQTQNDTIRHNCATFTMVRFFSFSTLSPPLLLTCCFFCIFYPDFRLPAEPGAAVLRQEMVNPWTMQPIYSNLLSVDVNCKSLVPRRLVNINSFGQIGTGWIEIPLGKLEQDELNRLGSLEEEMTVRVEGQA